MGAAFSYGPIRRSRRRGAVGVCSVVILFASLLPSVGCKRGKAPAPKSDVPAVAKPQAPAGAQPRPAPEADSLSGWLSGRLPPSVMEGAPRSGGELTVGIDVEPASLNAIVTTDWISKKIVHTRVYQGLVRVDASDDPRYRIVPQLAERWEVSPDGRVYTFHLRHDVHWHDGQAFSSRDVTATLDKVQDPRTLAASTRADFEELASYRAPDPFTVVVEWRHPYFLALDALADLTIQPAHLIEELSPAQYNEAATNPINRAPVGTGPFKFVRWDSAQKIVLERNPAYWGKPAYLDRIVFRVVPDATVRLQLAERGELQLVYRLKSEQWQHMSSQQLRQHWHRSRFYASKYNWLGWNLERSFFADARVRRALTLLVDRSGIIDKLMYGLPRATTCHFYWASPACDPEQRPLPYDPAGAARLLDAVDIRDHDGDGVRDRAGVPFRFTLMLPSTSSETALIAGKVKQDMHRAGVELEIERVQWSAFLQRLQAHDFDATILLWGGDARMDPTQVWHSSSIEGGSNFISYRNPELDALIERARVTLDADERNALFRRFGAILHKEQPYTFLYVPAELDLLHERVRGARPSLYWWQFEDIWLAPQPGAG